MNLRYSEIPETLGAAEMVVEFKQLDADADTSLTSMWIREVPPDFSHFKF